MNKKMYNLIKRPHKTKAGVTFSLYSLQWHHNGCDGISNHQPHRCLLNRLFRRRSKKSWKLRVTGLCEGNSLVTGEFPAKRASKAENVSIFDDVIMSCLIFFLVICLIWSIFKYLSLNPSSIMMQVMAWCNHATHHYWSHCWHRSMMPHWAS